MLTRATDDATTMTMTATATNTSATTPLCPSLYRSIAFWAVSEPSCGPRPSVLLLLSKPSFPNLPKAFREYESYVVQGADTPPRRGIMFPDRLLGT